MRYLLVIPFCLLVIPVCAQTICIREDFDDESYTMPVRTNTMNDTACDGTDTVWSNSYCTEWSPAAHCDGDTSGEACDHQDDCGTEDCIADEGGGEGLWPDYCGACKRWIDGGDEDESGATELCIRPGFDQYGFGFTIAPHSCTSVTTGDAMWIRFRIKPTTWAWDATNGVSMKLIEFGQGDGDRVIIFMRMANTVTAWACYPPNHATNDSCNIGKFGSEGKLYCPGGDSDCDNVTSVDIVGGDIQYDGLCTVTGAPCDTDSDCDPNDCVANSTPTPDHADSDGVDYDCIETQTCWNERTCGAFCANDNLAFPCIGPVPATGITNNNWYNVQMVWKSSDDNTGYIKIWVNNQTEGSPDMCIGDGCGDSGGFNHNATNWDTADINLGYFHGTAYPAGADEECFTLGHFEAVLNGSFDATFGVAAPASTTATTLQGVSVSGVTVQ